MAWFKKKPPAEPAEKSSHQLAADEMVAYEGQDSVPRDPRDWPKGKVSHLTFGNEGDEAYGDGATGKIGPAEVKHHEDGSVSVGGKKVDDPSKYKGKPITGGIIDQINQHAARNQQLRDDEEKAGREG